MRSSDEPEALALLQHEPVISFGRRMRPEHLLASNDQLALAGVTVVESDRGGDITFHGPGQIVAYPILNLWARGLGATDYVRALEAVIIDTLSCFGIEAHRISGRPGVWVGDAKIAAIGVRIQGGVTTHGFALNVETDLAGFDTIVPCGLNDASVTSMQVLLGYSPGIEAVESAICEAFEHIFESRLQTQPCPGLQAGVQSATASCPGPQAAAQSTATSCPGAHAGVQSPADSCPGLQAGVGFPPTNPDKEPAFSNGR